MRAIDIVEQALRLYGAPVYVRHEIVHNKFVVDALKAKGVVFIKELREAPAGAHPVIFSAHGVAKAVPEEAAARKLFTIDATCPLVTKVHREAQVHHKRGRRIILIGHVGHPEVIGTMGQLPPGAVTLVSSIDEVEALPDDDGRDLAYVTQTTLSVDDTREIVAALKARFPAIHVPPMEDICYATTNRQEAVKVAARQVEAVIVVGAANSSNSQRLREVAEREGARRPARRRCARHRLGRARRRGFRRGHRRRLGAGSAGRTHSRGSRRPLRHRDRDADDRERVDGLPAAADLARSGGGAGLRAPRSDRACLGAPGEDR